MDFSLILCGEKNFYRTAIIKMVDFFAKGVEFIPKVVDFFYRSFNTRQRVLGLSCKGVDFRPQ